MQAEGNPQAGLADSTAQFIATNEGMLFLAVFVLASMAGVARATRDDDYRHLHQLGSIASFSGFLGVGTIAVFRYVLGLGDSANGLCIGFACIIGLMGKEQDKFLRFIVRTVLKKFGLEDFDDK